MTPILNDEARWRKRAEEARTIAEQMSSPETRRIMLELAEDFDELARRAHERLDLGVG